MPRGVNWRRVPSNAQKDCLQSLVHSQSGNCLLEARAFRHRRARALSKRTRLLALGWRVATQVTETFW